MNLVFIIQGPVSIRDTDVNFNPYDSIQNLIKKILKFDAQVILSTWHDDLDEEQVAELERLGAHIILNEKISAPYTNHENKIIKHLANKFFMYHTTFEGIKFIEKNLTSLEETYVVKIRSDIEVDINMIIRHIERNYLSRLHTGILIQYLEPLLLNLSSMRIPDFWYGGMFKDFKILNELLHKRAKNGTSFSFLSHYDISLAFLYLNNIKSVTLVQNLEIQKILNPKIFVRISHAALRLYHTILFNKIYNKYFHLCDREVEKSIIWRGRLFYEVEQNSFNKRKFLE